jgi:hypothetical protein
MRVIVIIVIVLLLIGGGYWIWKLSQEENSGSEVVTKISAFNQTKNADAITVNASPRDVIVYTLTVENTTDDVVNGYEVTADIADITDAATLIDAQGANYNSSNNSLVWTPLDVPANGSFDKKFTVRVKDGQPASSDYIMTARFNNELAINIDRSSVAATPPPQPPPAPSPTPSPYQAPTTGPSVAVIALIAGGFTLGFLMFRFARNLSAKA